MLFTNATDIVQTNEADLLPGEVISEEGQALVWVRENGKSYLKVSTGAANETFAGFAIARLLPPTHQVAVEEFTVDATGRFTAGRLPEAGGMLVKIGGVKADQEADDAASAAGKVGVEGSNLYFHADDVGKKVYLQYGYVLNAVEARSFLADAPIGGLAANQLGRCGYIKLGNVATNMFDFAADWNDDSVLHPSLGANGRLTIGGSGTVLKGVMIKQAPTADRGYLIAEMASSFGQ